MEFVFVMVHARDYQSYVPSMLLAPELDVDEPALVVVFDQAMAQPPTTGGPAPARRTKPGHRYVCIVPDAAAPSLHADVDITGLTIDVVPSESVPTPMLAESAGPEPTITPPPAPAWVADLAGQLECDGPVAGIGGEVPEAFGVGVAGDTPDDALGSFLGPGQPVCQPARGGVHADPRRRPWASYAHLFQGRAKAIIVLSDSNPFGQESGWLVYLPTHVSDASEFDPHRPADLPADDLDRRGRRGCLNRDDPVVGRTRPLRLGRRDLARRRCQPLLPRSVRRHEGVDEHGLRAGRHASRSGGRHGLSHRGVVALARSGRRRLPGLVGDERAVAALDERGRWAARDERPRSARARSTAARAGGPRRPEPPAMSSRTAVAPSAFESLRPSGRRISGWWRNRGGAGRPRRRPRRIWAGVASRRSSPRTTRSIPWRRSSTTTHRAYVQLPWRSRIARSPARSNRSGARPEDEVGPRLVAGAERHPPGDARRLLREPSLPAPPGQPGPDQGAVVGGPGRERRRASSRRRRRGPARRARRRPPRRRSVVGLPVRRRSGSRNEAIGGSSGSNPSASRSSSRAASNSGRQRCRSWSSRRRTTRPPVARATFHVTSAFATWPRWR